MNLKAKSYEVVRKQKFQVNLAARLALLEEQGIEPGQRAKDAVVRNLRAKIRQVDIRLRSIAAVEKIGSQKVVKKQEKEAAEKAALESGEPKPVKKKAAKPAKKEKKAKVKEEAPAAAEKE